MRENGVIKTDPASFRDPAAHVYLSGGRVVRVIRKSYISEYNKFMSQVYPGLVEQGLIIRHLETSQDEERIVIQPDFIPMITYPYEWSFNMLREAALVTLKVNRIALENGMMLKDASAYNVQYYKGGMRFIDTTSFMSYSGDTPWPAYSQFLRHFVCPLLWMKYYNPYLMRLSEIYLDGVPVPLTARMLPLSARFNLRLWSHIFAQSLGFEVNPMRTPKMSRTALNAFLDDLYNLVRSLKYTGLDSDWLKYAEAGSYGMDSLASKKEIVRELLGGLNGSTLLDLGANIGDYSQMAANRGWNVISVDSDHDCIHSLSGLNHILPLVIDLCNPTPAIGWDNRERRSFWERIGKVDVIMALALIHHLSVRNNVPLGMVADLFAEHCQSLIIEWVPLEDRQAKRLLGTKNIPEYNYDVFLKEFGRRFEILRSIPISGSERRIYLMEKR